MRREGHIIEEVVEYSNMAESFDQVLSGTKRKKSRQGRYLIAHREEVIKELSERIASGTFHVTAKDIEEKDIIEAGKLRHIQFFKKLKNSIAVHAIMSVVDKHLKKRFDGKKRFAGAVVSIRELVNLPIVVKDFEVGVKTSQGEDRCVVSIEQNGEPKKFFTNSEEMKNILQQVSEMPDGFPFETTIKAETFGKGRTKYIFT